MQENDLKRSIRMAVLLIHQLLKIYFNMAKSYFTISELCKSNTAKQLHIDNTPSEKIKSNLSKLIEFLNPLREE